MDPSAFTYEVKLAARSGDPTWVGDELLSLAGFGSARVASYEVLDGGNPVMSQVFRVYISGNCDIPGTAIVKIPAKGDVDRRREAGTGSYVREVRVYELLKGMQGDFQPLIYAWKHDEQSKLAAVLIEDLGTMPQRRDFTVDVVREALSGLARIHKCFWGEKVIGSAWWMRNGPNADIFNEDTDLFAHHWKSLSSSSSMHPCDEPEVNRVGEYLADELLSVLAQLEDRPRTLTHGDLHTANMMFRRGESDVAPVLIDWQDAVYSGASSDVAKFLSTTLVPTTTREHFSDLIAGYHEELGNDIRSSYPFSAFRRDIILALLGTFANYVIAADTVESAYDDPISVNGSLRRVSANISVLGLLDEL